jgi:hypothetical protein
MHYLFSIGLWFFMFAPPDQKLPDAFYKIPESVREGATVIVSGTFSKGRTPCLFRPDGTRVWFMDAFFQIKQVYRGKVTSKIIRINGAMLPKTEQVSTPLEQGQDYLVLLRPGKQKMEKLKTAEGIDFWEALRDEEIIALVKLPKKR